MLLPQLLIAAIIGIYRLPGAVRILEDPCLWVPTIQQHVMCGALQHSTSMHKIQSLQRFFLAAPSHHHTSQAQLSVLPHHLAGYLSNSQVVELSVFVSASHFSFFLFDPQGKYARCNAEVHSFLQLLNAAGDRL